jgi:hyperosmotically inducible periplasmic protein
MKKLAIPVMVLFFLSTISFAQSNANSSAGAAQMQPNSSRMQSGNNQNTNQNQNGELALPEARTSLGGSNSTARISREVRHELLMDPYYSLFDNLAYRVDGNTVTLMGEVVDPATKANAEAAVKKIEGVDKVNDQIEVLPPSSMDDQIRRAEYRAIFGADGLGRYSMGAVPPIHIVVKSGHVQLVGVVDNETDKNLAGMRANTVPNVFSVQNDLQVMPSTTARK